MTNYHSINMIGSKKPLNCCKPNCFQCPYPDCLYDGMDTEDFSETNNRDYELYEESTGRKYHKGTDSSYRIERQKAYNRENTVKRDLTEYNRKYYKEHKEEILLNAKQKYDTRKNTKKCSAWRKKNVEHKREYDRQRYLRRKENAINASAGR